MKIFPNRILNSTSYACVHGFHLGYRKLVTRNCTKAQNVIFFIHKNISCVFSVYSDLANHMTINQVIGMPHGKQKPRETGCYHGIIHNDVIHFDITITKVAIQKLSTKNTGDFTINYHKFPGMIFKGE